MNSIYGWSCTEIVKLEYTVQYDASMQHTDMDVQCILCCWLTQSTPDFFARGWIISSCSETNVLTGR
jgi:hypothetical protein